MATIAETFERALEFHRQGSLAEAERLCRQVLELDGDHAAAHHLLGRVAHAQGNLALARDELARAVELCRDEPDFHQQLAEVCATLGQWREAEASCRSALSLRSDFAPALVTLGRALAAQGRLADAAASLRSAVAHAPEMAHAHFCLGSVSQSLGRRDEAIACYQRAIERDPRHVAAYNNLGVLFKQQKRFQEAVDCYQQVLRCEPDDPRWHVNLANLYAAMRQPKLAEAGFRRALELGPERLAADDYLRGVLLQMQGKFAEALSAFDAALCAHPELAEAHRNRAMLSLLLGNYAEGWHEYEWRWKSPGSEHLKVARPRWRGESIPGQTLLLLGEQGLGDTIQFVRYARWVKERSRAKVILRCQPSLYRLFKSVAGIDDFVTEGPSQVHFDCYMPLMSLPAVFATRVETIPAQVPYLSAEPGLVDVWRQKLGPRRGLRVGIVWQGDPKFSVDYCRSVPLAEFAPLAGCPGVELFSLQKHHGCEQLAGVAENWGVVDLADALDVGTDVGTDAFVDTAAVVKHLDLVVTSDTAIAHLAGALGVKVWVALPWVPDWRWLLARDDSPWYPTMRLFRQSRAGDWREAFARIAAALQAEVERTRIAPGA